MSEVRALPRVLISLSAALLLTLLMAQAAHAAAPSSASWFATPDTPRTNQSVDFYGSGYDPDGDPLTYAWDFDGDGPLAFTAASATNTISHTFTVAGVYHVYLKVSDGTGSFTSQEQTITVRDNWAPVDVSASPDTTADTYPRTGAATTIDFYGRDAEDPSYTPGTIDFHVNWGDGTAPQVIPSAGYVTSVPHTYATAGDYVIHYSAVDNDGAAQTTYGAPLFIHVAGNQPPSATQTYWQSTTANPTAGSPVDFQGYSEDPDGGSIVLYEWDFTNDGIYDASSAGNTQSHTFATPGTYNVTLRVTDNDPAAAEPGATQTYTYQITIVGTNAAQGYISAYSDVYYGGYGNFAKPNQLLDFYAYLYNLPAGVTATNYTWHWGDTSADTSTASTSTQHIYTSVGDYRPFVVVTLSNSTTLTVQYADYDYSYDYNPYTYTYSEGPLRVRANHAPIYPYIYSGDTTGCVHSGQSVPYYLSATDPDGGHIATFDVDWNSDGTWDQTGIPATTATSDSATVNHTYAVQGTYPVTVRAFDNDGGASVTNYFNTQTITVADENCLPYAYATYSPDQPQTSATRLITFNASDSYDTDGTIASYQWDWDVDGTYDDTGVSATHAYNTDGYHNYRLKVTDNLGGVSFYDGSVNTHTGNLPPTFYSLYISNNSATTTETVYFDASGYDSDGKIASYAWNFGDGTQATTTSPSTTHIYATAGTYHPTVTLTDDGGGSGPLSVSSSPGHTYTVTVTQAQPQATATWSPTEPHPADSIAFSAYATTPYNGSIDQYTWHWGDGTTTTTAVPNANHAYASAGSYSLTIDVHDTTGHSGTGPAQTVTVKTNWAPHASFTATPSCASDGTTISFNASATTDSDSPVTTYSWNFGDAVTENDTVPTTTHVYAGTGTYQVTLVAKDGANAASDPVQRTITIQAANCPPQDVYFTYTPQSKPSGSPITFTGHATDPDGTIVSYTWSWGDGTSDTISPTSGGSNTAHTFTNAGTYLVQVVARDNSGNAISYQQYMTIGVDTTPPSVVLTTPAAGATTTALPTYSGTAGTDPNDSGTVTVKVYSGATASGSPIQTLPATRSGANWTINGNPALPSGTYTAQAQQTDAANNTGYSAPHTFTVDATPPVISLTAPANGSSTNDTTPAFSGVAGILSGDNSAVVVTIYSGNTATGSPVQTLNTTRTSVANGAYTVDAAALAQGTYTAVASQSDAAGNTGSSAPTTFTVDTTAPVVTLATPANNAVTNDTTPTYSGTAGNLTGDSSNLVVNIYSGATATGTPVQTRPATRSGTSWTVDGVTGLADGTYTAQAVQPDVAGNSGTSTANTFRVDTIAPTVAVTAPANGSSTNDTTPTLSGTGGTATGDNTSVSVKIYSGSTATGSAIQTLTPTLTGSTWTVDAAALGQGTYTVQATQTDSATNTGTSNANTFVVDTTAPAVTLTAPTGTIANQSPSFSGVAGTATGDASSVTVRLYSGPTTSGTLLQTMNASRDAGTGAYTATLPAGTLLPDGLYTAQASQNDAAGNTGTSAADTFTVNGPPVVTITAPADNSVTSDNTQTITGARGTAPGDLQTVTVTIYNGSGTGGTVADTQTDPGSGSTWTVTTAALPDGTYTARASQSDNTSAGLSNTRTFRVDTTAPNVTVVAPGDGTATNDTTPTGSGIGGTAVGDPSTVTVNLYNGPTAGGVPLQTSPVTLGAGGAWTIDSATLNDGVYTVQATQTDNVGNVGTSNANTFTVDTVAPSVTLTGPAAGRSADATPTFTGTGAIGARDVGSVTVRVYSGSSATGAALQTLNGTLAGGSYSVDATSLADGTYTAQATQIDTAGNTGTSSTRTFTVDTTAPAVAITAPAASSSSTDTTPTITGTAGDAAGDAAAVTVNVYSGSAATGTPVQTLTATRSGSAWTVTATALAVGTYTAQATQSDDLGHVGTSAARTFTITAPAPPPPPATGPTTVDGSTIPPITSPTAANVIKTGIPVIVVTVKGSTVSAVLLLDKKSAKKAHIGNGKKAVIVGKTKTVAGLDGIAKLKLTVAAKYKKKLKKLKRYTLTTKITIVDAAGKKFTITRKVVIKH